MRILVLFLLIGSSIVACKSLKTDGGIGAQSIPLIGNATVMVFEKEHLYFDMELKESKIEGEPFSRIDAGRILLKKVQLPKYSKAVQVKLTVRLSSAGDPWDKTGSLFIIPKSGFNFLEDEQNFNALFPDEKPELSSTYPAISPYNGYKPAIELMRFFTPFGAGHFSNTKKAEKYKPVYIPKWENEVVWERDVTSLVSELEEEVYIGAFIDTWTKEGYQISVTLDYLESEIENHFKKETEVIPLLNTVRYIGPQRLFDGFAYEDINLTFELPEKFKKATLHYTVSGHGGHKDGDEFVKKNNIIKINNDTVFQKTPWRDDCASFRRFNPSSGVWTEKRTAMYYDMDTGKKIEKEIEEIIASSDYSRSNWCPGSYVEPEVIDIGHLSSGKHSISISIPEAQEEAEKKFNHWNVSAYIVLEK